MAYDPFSRGELPVGVRTTSMLDPERGGRRLEVEVWYPAGDDAAGRDVAPETRDSYSLMPGFPPNYQHAVRDASIRGGSYPLIVFSHGFGGHRRQSTFLCTHLASHGYVVVGPDHTGNTIVHLMQGATAGSPRPGATPALYSSTIRHRPVDARFVIDRVFADGIGDVGDVVDRELIGMTGHSFGGFTTLATVARERRILAAVPLAPAGGRPELRSIIDFEWGHVVPTLVIAGDRDSILPIDGIRSLFEDIRAPKQMVVITDCDHMHFVDAAKQVHEMLRMMPSFAGVISPVTPLVPFDELCSAQDAHDTVKGLTLAHFDAFLRDSTPAKQFVSSDLVEMLAARGIRASR